MMIRDEFVTQMRDLNIEPLLEYRNPMIIAPTLVLCDNMINGIRLFGYKGKHISFVMENELAIKDISDKAQELFANVFPYHFIGFCHDSLHTPAQKSISKKAVRVAVQAHLSQEGSFNHSYGTGRLVGRLIAFDKDIQIWR